MTDLDQITATLAQQIADRILNQPHREISAAEPLLTTGLIDSFGLVDLAMLIEDEFGVRIADSELNSATFDTLTQLAELIKERM